MDCRAVAVVLLASAGCALSARAQPTCPALPAPSGPTVQVSPSTPDLRGVVAGVAAGTTVLFADGYYDLSCGDSGCRLQVVTDGVALRSLSGDRDAVVLDGAYTTNELVSISASNVTVADMTLQRAWDHPIHISGPGTAITGVLLHNLRIVDPGQQAVKVNPVGAGYVDDSTMECCSIELTDSGREHIRNSCYTGGFDAHQAQGWWIRHNRISGFWCDEGLSEHAIHLWNSCRDTLVEENVILDCARGIGFGLGSTGTTRPYPDNPYPEAGYLGHIDGVIRNNMVAASDPDLFSSEYGFDAGIAIEQARHPVVVHNTVMSTTAPFSSIEWRWDNTVVDIANNLVSHNLRDRGGAANLTTNLVDAPGSWVVSVPDGNLHLVGFGVAPVDAGTVLAAGVADRDLDGEHRDATPDIGADEIMHLECDADDDGFVGATDIPATCTRIFTGSSPGPADCDGGGAVDAGDLAQIIGALG